MLELENDLDTDHAGPAKVRPGTIIRIWKVLDGALDVGEASRVQIFGVQTGTLRLAKGSTVQLMGVHQSEISIVEGATLLLYGISSGRIENHGATSHLWDSNGTDLRARTT